MRNYLDSFLSALCRLVARIFFRRVELVGLERFPRGRPLLVISNHGNNLIDPMLLFGFLPVPVRFLAKSTLWDNWGLRFLMQLGGAIPVYRRQDAADTSQNLETFTRCRETLADGGAIALFPEGLSHDEPALQPLKTGVARIALEAESEHGPLGIRIVPVGLVFERRHEFRSRVLIQVGEPLDPAGDVELYTREPKIAVRELTQRVGEALAGVTLNYDSWNDARLIERAADIFARPELDVPSSGKLAARVPVRQAVIEGYRELATEHPERIGQLATQVERYDRLLRLAGLSDEQVASSYPRSRVARFVGLTTVRLLLFLPVALAGTMLNWLPYKIPGWVTRHLRLERKANEPATYKVMISFFLFPLFWLVESLLAGKLWGPLAGLGMALFAPLSGYIALLFHEHLGRFRGESRAYLLQRSRSRLIRELAPLRQSIYEEVVELAELYRQRGD
jgi:glycerol-3-phosphate O-acyltransferase/dihydroxyacetone phosphate acyltransferase